MTDHDGYSREVLYERESRRLYGNKRHDPSHASLLHPTYAATSPCDALGCTTRQHDVAACKEASCPFTWQRQGAEDRAKAKERDRREAEAKA